MAADIDAAVPGHEMWSASFAGFYDTKGTQLGTTKPTQNFRIYWDGDLQDDLLDVTGSAPNTFKVDSWKNGRLLTTNSAAGGYTGHSNNYTKANPVLSADLFGDWREELIVRQDDNSALLVYSTTIPTTYRLYTLMHDPVYRAGVAWQNTAYNQPPHLGFWLGAGVDKAPKPDIKLVKSTSGIRNRNPSRISDAPFSARRIGRRIAVQSPWNEPATVRFTTPDGQILSEHRLARATASELDVPAGNHGTLVVALRSASGRTASTTIAGF
jgi:hypothetical protein